jgi:hypothetical protein
MTVMINDNGGNETQPTTQQEIEMQQGIQVVPISIEQESLFMDELARQAAAKGNSKRIGAYKL